MYKYIANTWKNSKKPPMEDAIRQRLVMWRKQPAIIRIEKPQRLDKARGLGYKAKSGFVIVRVRVRRGGLRKVRAKGGRRQRHMGLTKITPRKNMRMIAEERADKKFPNLEVVNSYWVGEDGQHKWFEVLLVDASKLTEKENTHLLGRTPKGRSHRGLTSAGRKSKGLI